jgi:hypothetical protein
MKLLGNKTKKPMAVRVSPQQAAERKINRMLKENSDYRSKKKR